MSSSSNIKAQRDRFLAFAFTTADLFLEIGTDGTIKFAVGAGKSLTGVDSNELIGKNWLEIFRPEDKIPLNALKKQLTAGKRVGPIAIRLDSAYGDDAEGLFSGITMPDNDTFYAAIGFAGDLMSKLLEIEEMDEDNETPPEDVAYTMMKALKDSSSKGKDADLTLFNINDAEDLKVRLGDKAWDQYTDAIADILKSQSLDGKSAAQFSEGQFSVVHDKSKDSETLTTQITDLAKESDIETPELNVTTVDADVAALSEREASRALLYTMTEYEKNGGDLNINNLQGGFKDFLNENTKKITELKSTIEQLSFQIHFQPIVDLKTFGVSHFEVLTRFHADKENTQDIINFAEDVGLAKDIDLAICNRAMNYLQYKANTNSFKFAINLSGQSIQDDAFFVKLNELLDEHSEHASRVLFEITESSEITNLDNVNKKISMLQEKGYKVCLDDFGAGSASIQYIHQLKVDYLKIDGKYTASICKSKRDRVMVKHIVSLCNDLDVLCVAERIETLEELKVLDELGVHHGQGFFFGEPQSTPTFKQSSSLMRYEEERKESSADES